MLKPAGSSTPLPLELLSTATRTSQDIAVKNAKILVIVFKTANKASSPTFTISVQGKTASGAYYTIWTAAAAIAANGTAVYVLTPYVAPTGTLTESKIMPIPSIIRILATYAGTPASDKMDTTVDIDLVAA